MSRGELAVGSFQLAVSSKQFSGVDVSACKFIEVIGL